MLSHSTIAAANVGMNLMSASAASSGVQAEQITTGFSIRGCTIRRSKAGDELDEGICSKQQNRLR
jgi:hypothetical protein